MTELFDDDDRRTPAYKKLLAYLDDRIGVLREENDSAKLDALDTAHKRGRIAELKSLLAKAKPSPAFEVNED